MAQRPLLDGPPFVKHLSERHRRRRADLLDFDYASGYCRLDTGLTDESDHALIYGICRRARWCLMLHSYSARRS
jgi:hypothetical protein